MYVKHATRTWICVIVVTYSQFDSNIRVFYVFLGFFRNILKYFIQRPIFKPLYFYNDFLKILENTSFWAPLRNTRISYVTSMICVLEKVWSSFICLQFDYYKVKMKQLIIFKKCDTKTSVSICCG
jgi:hypothetical protein